MLGAQSLWAALSGVWTLGAEAFEKVLPHGGRRLYPWEACMGPGGEGLRKCLLCYSLYLVTFYDALFKKSSPEDMFY